MKNTLFVCLIVFLGSIMSCKNDTKPQSISKEGFITYTSDSLGFSIERPENFAPKPYIKPQIPISFYEINSDTSNYLFHPNLLVYIESLPVEMRASDFVQASRTQLKLMMQSGVPSFATYGLDSMHVDNKLVTSYKYDVPKNDSTSFTSKMYIIMLKGRAMQLQGTTTSSKFEAYEPLFNQMIQSIKFTKE